MLCTWVKHVMVERLFILKAVSHAGTANFEGNYTLTRVFGFPHEASWLFAVIFSVLERDGGLWGLRMHR